MQIRPKTIQSFNFKEKILRHLGWKLSVSYVTLGVVYILIFLSLCGKIAYQVMSLPVHSAEEALTRPGPAKSKSFLWISMWVQDPKLWAWAISAYLN